MPTIKQVITNSTLISFVEYDAENKELEITFKKYYADKINYANVSPTTFSNFINSESIGRYYLSIIKPNYSQKISQQMADKVIKIKIDVTKINKAFLFTGEKGTYLNCTLLYNEEQDTYGNNGMVIQDVPTEIYKKEKAAGGTQTKGAILGNGKVWANAGGGEETKPGVQSGTMGASPDDLPF